MNEGNQQRTCSTQEGVRDQWVLSEGLGVRVDDAVKNKQLGCCRVTEGFYEDGSSFVERDSWTNPSCAHFVTAKPWIGLKVFMCSGRPESWESRSEGECRRHNLRYPHT